MGWFGFLTPKWKNKNPEVRLAAVRAMGAEDLGRLKAMAGGDTDPRVQIAALGQIADRTALEELIRGPLAPEVFHAARQRIDRMLCEAALGGSELAGTEAAIERIEDPALIERLAVEAPTPTLRTKAVNRIDDQEVLCRIVEKNCGKEPAKAAIAKILDEALLARIARSGSSKLTRRIAAEKLEALKPTPAVPPSPPEPVPTPEPMPVEELRSAPTEEERAAAEALNAAAARAAEEARMAAEARAAEEAHAAAAARAAAEAAREEQVRRAAKAEEEARAQREIRERRGAICAELEALSEAEDRASAGRRARDLRQEWAKLPLSSDKEARALGERFRAASDRFSARQARFTEEQDWLRWNNRTLKEELCTAVEALDAVEDLATVADHVKEAQKRWQEIGPAPKADAEALWQRFRSACDRSFERCKPHFEELERRRAESVVRREELCRQAESHVESTDWKESAESLKRLQAEWKSAGPIPRKQEEELYSRFRQACNRFFERRKSYLAGLDETRRVNQTAKEQLCERAEALSAAPDRRHARVFRELQAEWKRIGPAPRDVEQALWERFRSGCDRYFGWLDSGRQENLQQKETLCAEVEALVAGVTDEAGALEIEERLAELQKRWMGIGPAPKDQNDAIWERFHKPFRDLAELRGAQRSAPHEDREGESPSA